MIEEHVDSLDVEAVVSAIPETIVVQIKDVGVGDSLHARDISLPEGITLASPEDTLVVTCHLKAAAKSTEEEAAEGMAEDASASPEVITEKKTETEDA
jgi:large subunit ribosomal protein L25